MESMSQVIVLRRLRFSIFLWIYSLDTFAAAQNGS